MSQLRENETRPPDGIVSLSISCFRSFFRKQTINFAMPNKMTGSGLTLIVGENNSGKSAIFDSLRFSSPYARITTEERHRKYFPRIELVANGDVPDIKRTFKFFQGKYDRTRVTSTYGEGYEWPGPFNIHTISTNRRVPGNLNVDQKYVDFQQLDGNEYYEKYGEGFLSDGFDDLYYAVTQGIHKSVDVSLPSDSLYEEEYWKILIAIDGKADLRVELNDLVRRLFPDFYDWKIEFQDNQYVLKYISKDGDVYRFDFLGEGLRSIFKIFSVFVTGYYILVIDEPELSLHPHAQRKLLEILAEEAKFSQIIILTHSPHFIDWSHIRNGAKLSKINKVGGKSKVCSLSTTSVNGLIRGIRRDWQRPHIFDAVAKEIFFGRSVVFLEGQEDVGLLRLFCEDYSIRTNFSFFGYGAGGASNIPHLLQVAKDIGVNAGAIFDGDKIGREVYEHCRAEFGRQFCLQILSSEDIRDKEDKRKLGLFDRKGRIKDENLREVENIFDKFNRFFDKLDRR